MRCAKLFDLLGLDQGDVLTRISMLTEVAITEHSSSAFNHDALTFPLRCTALRANENSFNDHDFSQLVNDQDWPIVDLPRRQLSTWSG